MSHSDSLQVLQFVNFVDAQLTENSNKFTFCMQCFKGLLWFSCMNSHNLSLCINCNGKLFSYGSDQGVSQKIKNKVVTTLRLLENAILVKIIQNKIC